MVENDLNIPSDSPQLEYIIQKSQDNKVSKATNTTLNLRQQYADSDAPALNTSIDYNNNVFNM